MWWVKGCWKVIFGKIYNFSPLAKKLVSQWDFIIKLPSGKNWDMKEAQIPVSHRLKLPFSLTENPQSINGQAGLILCILRYKWGYLVLLIFSKVAGIWVWHLIWRKPVRASLGPGTFQNPPWLFQATILLFAGIFLCSPCTALARLGASGNGFAASLLCVSFSLAGTAAQE